MRPQLLAQPNPNPNNRPVQLIQIIEDPLPNIEQKQCNELKLILGRTILPIETTPPSLSQYETSIGTSSTESTKIDKNKETTDQQKPEELKIATPPFPEILNIPKSITNSEFDTLGELRILCVKIPLL